MCITISWQDSKVGGRQLVVIILHFHSDEQSLVYMYSLLALASINQTVSPVEGRFSHEIALPHIMKGDDHHLSTDWVLTEKCLTKNWDGAALGLLTISGTDCIEASGICWSCLCYTFVSHIRFRDL